MSQQLWLKFLHALPPEWAHRITVRVLQAYGALPFMSPPEASGELRYWGLSFANRFGIAAGFDKDGLAHRGLMRMGWGFVEVGTVTPKPQIGNPLPRLFRLLEERAIINRMGFNNQGIELLVRRLHKYHRQPHRVLGINIGANKTSADPISDYTSCYTQALPYADYFTVNLSSPNTPGLREWQQGEKMHSLLSCLKAVRDSTAKETGLRVPVLIKIAPDWDDWDACRRLLDAGVAQGFDGYVISNTTINHPGDLRSDDAGQIGGLSGAPLFPRSTALLARSYQHLSGAVPLIGAGGISSLSEAILKLQAGAALFQVYSALTFAPQGILPHLRQKCDNIRAGAILYSTDVQGMIGCLARELGDEQNVRNYLLSQNADKQ